MVGGLVGLIGVVVSFELSLIDYFVMIFNEIGLPLGGLAIALFLGYFWKTENAILELEQGNKKIRESGFHLLWVILIKYVSPLLIGLVLLTTVWGIFT